MATLERPPATMSCPMCKNKSMGQHCANAGCRWFDCRNIDCNATIDPALNIGHYYDPNRSVVERGPGKGTVRRLRLVLVNGTWRHRDIGDER